MTESLQYAFIKTRGKPVQRGQYTIFMHDHIPVSSGSVTIRFLSAPKDTPVQGVRLHAGAKGKITMADGSKAQILYIWHEAGLPPIVTYFVNSPKEDFTVCNIYRITHRPDFVTEDRWTGNAGMTLSDTSSTMRRYKCSDGLGDFDPTDLEFEIEWRTTDIAQPGAAANSHPR